MEQPKPNYFGIKRLLIERRNTKDLQRLVNIYLDREVSSIDEYPFLKGIDYDKDSTYKLSNVKLLCLIISGAEPQEDLIRQALDRKKLESTFILYQRGIISTEIFLNELETYTNTQQVLEITSRVLEGKKHSQIFPFAKLEEIFIKSFHRELCCPDSQITQYLPIALTFFKMPYNENHMKLSEKVILGLKIVAPYENDKNNQYSHSIALLQNFFDEQLDVLSEEELINELDGRPDYQMILNERFLHSVRRQFIGGSLEGYDKYLEAIYRLLSLGILDRIYTAFKMFPELLDRRIDLLNYWVEHDMAIEVDIFATIFLSDQPDITRELEEKYLQAKHGGTIEQAEKKHTIIPIQSTD